jgi:membrane protein YqaA with SNARE-associated domain
MTATLSPALGATVLFVYAFLSNVALAVVPHEPAVIWFGPRLGILATAAIATLGTVAAAWVDHRLFATAVDRLANRRAGAMPPPSLARRWFSRAPFAVLAASGVTPLPFFPFKLLAFAARYPRDRYLAAVAAGRLPRYLLLAWLGVTVQLPFWALALAGVLLLIPTLRVFRCAIPNAN